MRIGSSTLDLFLSTWPTSSGDDSTAQIGLILPLALFPSLYARIRLGFDVVIDYRIRLTCSVSASGC